MRCWQDAGTDKNTNCYGHFFFVDQVIEHRGQFPVRGKRQSVLYDHRAGGSRRIVLCRHVDPVVPHGAWKDPAGPFQRAFDFALRNSFLWLRVDGQLHRKLVGSPDKTGQAQ